MTPPAACRSRRRWSEGFVAPILRTAAQPLDFPVVVREHGVDSCAHTPVRTCIGCRVRGPKQQLLRVVAVGSDEGSLVVADPGARAPGRGAYLHPTLACLEFAVRRRALARALRVRGSPSTSPLRDYLEQQAAQN